MIYKLYGDTYAVRLERGEEVVASIAELCEKEGIPIEGHLDPAPLHA